MSQKTSVADVDRAIELYASGLSLRAAGAYIGRSGQCLLVHLRERGIKTRPRSVKGRFGDGYGNKASRNGEKPYGDKRVYQVVRTAVEQGILIPSKECEECAFYNGTAGTAR